MKIARHGQCSCEGAGKVIGKLYAAKILNFKPKCQISVLNRLRPVRYAFCPSAYNLYTPVDDGIIYGL